MDETDWVNLGATLEVVRRLPIPPEVAGEPLQRLVRVRALEDSARRFTRCISRFAVACRRVWVYEEIARRASAYRRGTGNGAYDAIRARVLEAVAAAIERLVGKRPVGHTSQRGRKCTDSRSSDQDDAVGELTHACGSDDGERDAQLHSGLASLYVTREDAVCGAQSALAAPTGETGDPAAEVAVAAGDNFEAAIAGVIDADAEGGALGGNVTWLGGERWQAGAVSRVISSPGIQICDGEEEGEGHEEPEKDEAEEADEELGDEEYVRPSDPAETAGRAVSVINALLARDDVLLTPPPHGVRGRYHVFYLPVAMAS